MKTIIRTLVGGGALLGSVLGCAPTVGANPPSPAPRYPPIDPSRVECSAFRPADEKLCYRTANDLYQLFELIFDQSEANDIANALQEALPTTPQLFPDGTVVYGVEGFGKVAADWTGSKDFRFGEITNTFRYRPLDVDTVVVYGIVNFTIEDREHGTRRVLSSAQTELFRRNREMARGWEHVYEQLAYTQPLWGARQRAAP